MIKDVIIPYRLIRGPGPMVSSPSKVIVVLDKDFGEKLTALAPGVPVWIVESPSNRTVAERFWKEHPSEPHQSGITTFKNVGQLSSEDLLVSMLDTIDLHHGIHSSDTPYTAIEILGVSPSEKVATKLAALGFNEFMSNHDCLVAKRQLPAL